MTAEAVGLRSNHPRTILTLSAVVKLLQDTSGSPTAAHFWRRVDASDGPDACWPWTRSRFDAGYGCVWADGRAQKAHRIAWRFVHGPIPEGARILHRCDNPPCCNPNHLFAGSMRDNTLDMVAKGRHGGTVRRKLTEAQIPGIRERYAAGATLKQLGSEYGVSWVAIWKVVHRQTWRHVA